MMYIVLTGILLSLLSNISSTYADRTRGPVPSYNKNILSSQKKMKQKALVTGQVVLTVNAFNLTLIANTQVLTSVLPTFLIW